MSSHERNNLDFDLVHLTLNGQLVNENRCIVLKLTRDGGTGLFLSHQTASKQLIIDQLLP